MLQYIESVKGTMIWCVTKLGIEAIVVGIAAIYILVCQIDRGDFTETESETCRCVPRSVVDRLGEYDKVVVVTHYATIVAATCTQREPRHRLELDTSANGVYAIEISAKIGSAITRVGRCEIEFE